MRLPHLALAHIGFAALVTAAALFAGSAAAQTTVRVALDGNFSGLSAPFLLAQDRGYFRAEKLDVAIDALNSGPGALSRAALQTADFAVADINAFIKFRDQNPDTPLKAVFMIYNKPPYAIITRKSRGITAPKDLEGKRLGAPEGELTTALWPVFAKLNGIDLSKVKIENVAAAVREPILAAGQIDAITGGALTTYISIKERGVPADDLVLMPMADYGLQLYGDAIIVNTKFAAQKPDAVKGFLRAYLKGLQATIRDPAQAITSVLKRNENAKQEIELERLRTAIDNDIMTDEVLEDGIGNIDAARFAMALDQLAQVMKLEKKPTAADVFDPSYLPPASQRKTGTRQRAG